MEVISNESNAASHYENSPARGARVRGWGGGVLWGTGSGSCSVLSRVDMVTPE